MCFHDSLMVLDRSSQLSFLFQMFPPQENIPPWCWLPASNTCLEEIHFFYPILHMVVLHILQGQCHDDDALYFDAIGQQLYLNPFPVGIPCIAKAL